MGHTLKQALGYVQCRIYFLGEIMRKNKIGVISVKNSKKITKDDPVYITAHRGFSGVAPENSYPAFELACKEDYYAIECDVNIINASFSVPDHNAFEDVVQLAYDSDIICVASAGNDETGCA